MIGAILIGAVVGGIIGFIYGLLTQNTKKEDCDV